MAVFRSLEELFEDMHAFYSSPGQEFDAIAADDPERMRIGWTSSGSRFGLWQIGLTDARRASDGPLSSVISLAGTRGGRLSMVAAALKLCCPKCHKLLVPVHDEELCVSLSVMRS